MEAIKRIGGKLWRGASGSVTYNRHLKNGTEVWLAHVFGRTVPPLALRNGIVWHHGPRDQPIVMLNEICLQNLYERIDPAKGGTVLDIGANIGAVTTFWAEGRPDLSFHCYEPNPESHATLVQNVAANRLGGQVTVYREAVGSKHGKLELWTGVPTAMATSYGDKPAPGAHKITVPMITLDEAWKRTGRDRIRILKIDTEGAEGDILHAASDAMLAAVETACIEWHDNIVPGSFDRCRRKLEAAGFEFRTHAHPWGEGIFYARRKRGS